jgi:hypothetical protein
MIVRTEDDAFVNFLLQPFQAYSGSCTDGERLLFWIKVVEVQHLVIFFPA